MTVLRASTLLAAACVLVTWPLACSGENGSEAEDETETTAPVAGIAKVTMSEDGCELEGRDAVSDGHLTIEFVNETSGEGTIELLRLADGITWEALEAHIEEEGERLEQGVPPIGYDLFASRELAAEFVGPERRYLLTPQPTDLEPGAHAFLCIRSPALDLAGPLEILPKPARRRAQAAQTT